MAVRTEGNGNDDTILSWYRTQAEDAYLQVVKHGFDSPVVLILDPLYEQCQNIIAAVLGPEAVSGYRTLSRSDEKASMLVGAWPQDVTRKTLPFPGVSQIIDKINAAGDFAIFILDGDGRRWFNCPVPKQ